MDDINLIIKILKDLIHGFSKNPQKKLGSKNDILDEEFNDIEEDDEEEEGEAGANEN